MKRLTHRYTDGEAWASIYKVSTCRENECKGPIIDRLAAYEDTGLTPEEIMRWKKADGEGRLIILPESRKRAIVIRDNRCCSDFTMEELNNLLEAWDAGLLAVLPCKAGKGGHHEADPV